MKQLNAEEFETEIGSEDRTVVEFFAPWCGFCKSMERTVEAVEKETSGTRLYKLNIDEQTDISQKYGIRSVPTFLVFQNGEVVSRSSGVMSKAQLYSSLGQSPGG